MLHVLLVRILGISAVAQQSNLPYKKIDASIQDRLDLSIFKTNSGKILYKSKNTLNSLSISTLVVKGISMLYKWFLDLFLEKYLWPVVRYKQCSESLPILSKLTPQDCHAPCSTIMARFECQIICMKRDDCVGINYSESRYEYRYMCGICTGDDLQKSAFGFQFHPNPRKKNDGIILEYVKIYKYFFSQWKISWKTF